MHTDWTAPCAPADEDASGKVDAPAAPRKFSAGWWIAPMLLAGLSIWAAAIYGVYLLLN